MKTQPLAIFILAIGLAFAGCSNKDVAQKTQPKAQVNEAVVSSSRVVVIPNPYVDDSTLAGKAADEAKQELIKRGFKIVASEAEADVVAIPTIETNVVTSSTKPTDLFVESAGLQMDRSWTVNNSLGSLSSPAFQISRSSFGTNGGMLVIEGFRKDAWDKALIVNELQLPPLWKVRVALPASLKPSNEGAAVARTADTDFVLPH